MWSWATCFSWPFFRRWARPDDLQRFHPTSSVLWFCEENAHYDQELGFSRYTSPLFQYTSKVYQNQSILPVIVYCSITIAETASQKLTAEKSLKIFFIIILLLELPAAGKTVVQNHLAISPAKSRFCTNWLITPLPFFCLFLSLSYCSPIHYKPSSAHLAKVLV